MFLAARWLASIWSNSGWLELASAISTVVLIIGAVLEDWFKLKHIGLLFAKLILLRSSAFERCVLKKLVSHSLGALMVVLGIGGELIFETRTFIVEGTETTKSQTEVARLKVRAGELEQANLILRKQAGDAADTAGRARDNARAAKQKADAVSEQADDLERELATTSSKLALVEANRQKLQEALTNLEICTAPRVIPLWSGNDKTSADPLRSFKGFHAIVVVVNDPEARRAARNIESILGRAGWTATESPAPADPNRAIQDGVFIKWHEMAQDSINAANALADFLHSHNWIAVANNPFSVDKDIPVRGVQIEVGLYPPTELVTSPADKAFTEEETKAIRETEASQDAAREKVRNDRLNDLLKDAPPEQWESIKAKWKRNADEADRVRKDAVSHDMQPCPKLNEFLPQ